MRGICFVQEEIGVYDGDSRKLGYVPVWSREKILIVAISQGQSIKNLLQNCWEIEDFSCFFSYLDSQNASCQSICLELYEAKYTFNK